MNNPINIAEKITSTWYHRFYQVLMLFVFVIAALIIVLSFFLNQWSGVAFILLLMALMAITYRIILYVCFGWSAFQAQETLHPPIKTDRSVIPHTGKRDAVKNVVLVTDLLGGVAGLAIVFWMYKNPAWLSSCSHWIQSILRF
jgi:hypothetical protein